MPYLKTCYNIRTMKVLLLAAGRSRRVKPIEDKNFLRMCGKFLIEHQLDALRQAGLTDIIIVGGAHNMEQLKEVAGDATVIEQENLDEGMAGALLSAESHLGGELFIVSSNDAVDMDAYSSMLEASKSGADAYLLAYKVQEYFPGGYLKVDGRQITDIVEKPGEGNEPSDMVNVVLHIHKDSAALIEKLKNTKSDNDDTYEVALNELMDEQTFEAVPYEGYWLPVKHPWHILDLMEHFLNQCATMIHTSAQVSDSAIIKGNVVIAAGAKVFDQAVIQGPAYIGKDSIVATNALIRGSILGERCIVGFGTEVARSFIGDDCWFHSNYVGDTIMGSNNSFGAGAVCANLRLDEKEIGESKRNKLGPILGNDIRVGVNTSLMPGIKIGSGTFITSGLVVDQDIEPGKFVSGKTELTIQDNRAELDKSAREEMKKKL